MNIKTMANGGRKPYIRSMTETLFHAVLVAAGQSRRLGGAIAKPWVSLAGMPVMSHALDGLHGHEAVQGGVIVAHTDMLDEARILAESVGWQAVAGGAERSLSVRAGLEALAALTPQPHAVLIHDAARPFIPPDVISRLAACLDGGYAAAVPTLHAVDSLKRVEDGLITGRIDRESIARVQTPQAFAFVPLLAQHRKNSDPTISDDSTLMEDAGIPVVSVAGDPLLAKITTPQDLTLAKIVAQGIGMPDNTAMIETRMATGFDVHRFSDSAGSDSAGAIPGPIRLGGVDIDHARGFEAHSDGDVALHALTDAIYGLNADGDIGAHFPPSDEAWRNHDSAFFLDRACVRLREAGGRLCFCDLTIIAETPHIAPHREAMRCRIAAITGLDVSRVSVKATTSEGLGFTGRGEGVAVQAAATAQFIGISGDGAEFIDGAE